MLYSRIFRKTHSTVNTKGAALAQMSNTDRQQITNNYSNSTCNTTRLLTACQLGLRGQHYKERFQRRSHPKDDANRSTRSKDDTYCRVFIDFLTGREVAWKTL
ncbi:hypothetical protein AVEN_169092-1 [Araneus ventricosus]|uniref:Uncharacterized protein n=1 Tax=Araneus ventricosus TaxID=182803 RepID=A0A4Y2MIW9_ARAVE|nr:hypothetical protein AVEN_169092-1 [Araneus ventricosus]